MALLDEGVLTTRVAETYALDDAVKAHARLAVGGDAWSSSLELTSLEPLHVP